MKSKIFFRNRIFSSTFYFLILPLSLSRYNLFSPSREECPMFMGRDIKKKTMVVWLMVL